MKPTMEMLFATLPDIPEGFEEGCREYANPVPIYYRRQGKSAECRCGRCNIGYEIDYWPTRGEKTRCPVCGTYGIYEWMSCTRQKGEYFNVVLVQRRTDNNLVVRHFKCHNVYELHYKQNFTVTEVCRYFMDLGDFYRFNLIWNGKWGTGPEGITYADVLYPGYAEAIENSNLKYFKQGYGGFIEELKAYSRNPALEMFGKIGLQKLRDELVNKEGRSKYINRRGKNLKAQLRLKDKQRINFLIEKNGGLLLLRILQIEEKKGVHMTDEQRTWVCNRFRAWNGEYNVDYCLKHMSLQRLINHIDKYKEDKKNGYGTDRVLGKYVDYLKMREELGYDLTNEVYLFPRDLKEKHDEMVAERNARSDEKYAEDKERQFAEIRARFQDLLQTYGFMENGLLIRPAQSATEIIQEGRTLHHCVGRMGYMEKHNNGKSFILFLRHAETPEKPYYTIEIRDKQIIQWYGIRDSKPDKEIVGPWLNHYIDQLGGTQCVYAS